MRINPGCVTLSRDYLTRCSGHPFPRSQETVPAPYWRWMPLGTITLQGTHVRLEPLAAEHAEPLVAAAADGELWNLAVTTVPCRDTIGDYLERAFRAQSTGKELPFVVRDRTRDRIVGTTRYRNVEL